MKKTFIIFLFVTLLTLILSPLATSKTTTASKQETIYSAYIDKFISMCESKVKLRKSKLQNIRREAALYCFKANFFKRYKEELIQDMIAENVGVKRHKIHYYLNKKFFEMFRAALAAIPHMRKNVETLL